MRTASAIHSVAFSGSILRRRFWLYVWEITPPDRETLFYVGRTGDSSSTNAQSPFNRMGQHLGFSPASNMLRRHLVEHGAQPERCGFRLIALGPLEEESSAETRYEHDERRDRLAAMERALAELLAESGCRVMNRVACRKLLDAARFAEVRAAFGTAFPQLAEAEGTGRTGAGP